MGVFAFDNIAETIDSAAIKTTETAKTTKAATVKINIKNIEASFFAASFRSMTTLVGEIKLPEDVAIGDSANLSGSMLTNTCGIGGEVAD